MPRTFITLTQDDLDAKVATNISSRELELASYDFSRASHEHAIASLGNIQWDESVTAYRGMGRDQMVKSALADGKDADTIQKIGDLLALDFHTAELQAVILETAKSERFYNALLAALPEGAQRDTALATVAAQAAPVQKQ